MCAPGSLAASAQALRIDPRISVGHSGVETGLISGALKVAAKSPLAASSVDSAGPVWDFWRLPTLSHMFGGDGLQNLVHGLMMIFKVL